MYSASQIDWSQTVAFSVKSIHVRFPHGLESQGGKGAENQMKHFKSTLVKSRKTQTATKIYKYNKEFRAICFYPSFNTYVLSSITSFEDQFEIIIHVTAIEWTVHFGIKIYANRVFTTREEMTRRQAFVSVSFIALVRIYDESNTIVRRIMF